jgi:hypothetical protein
MNELKSGRSIGEPPACFLDSACPVARKHLAMWWEFVEHMPSGVLPGLDPSVLEEACRLQVQIIESDLGASAAMFGQMLEYLRTMRMTPASRGKVSGPLKTVCFGWSDLADL